MPNRCTTVSIREVGLRDGLQILAETVPTPQKLEWLRGSYEAGLREIEVGISTAFGCTIQGRVEPDEVLRLLAGALAAGAERAGLPATMGSAGAAR